MKTLKTDDSLGSKDIDKRLAVYLSNSGMTEGQIKSVLLKPESVRKEMFSTFIKREDLEKKSEGSVGILCQRAMSTKDEVDALDAIKALRVGLKNEPIRLSLYTENIFRQNYIFFFKAITSSFFMLLVR
jgi:hypothetical protein